MKETVNNIPLRTLVEINVSLNWGSTGIIAEQIGLQAEKNGWKVYMVHGARYKNPSHFPHIQVTSKIGEVFHWLLSTLFDAQGLGSVISTRLFVKKLKKIKPSIVHIHNIHGCYINYPILFRYLRESGVPVVWTLHDCWSFTGHCAYYTEIGCEKWMSHCHHCPIVANFPKSLIDRSYSNYNKKNKIFNGINDLTLVPVTYWLGSEVKKSLLREKNINVIHNGIDIEHYSFRKSAIKEKYNIGAKYMLLSVASGFAERKGLEDFNRLSTLLPDEYKIVLVGGIEASCNIQLSDKILLLPLLKDPQELVEFYSAADVLLSLSLAETFGLTIAEAMSCGTPSVVYDNTAQPEIVSPETGCVVKTGDVNAVKDSVIYLCSKGKDTYMVPCRERAKTLFDKNRQCSQYVDLFDKILKNQDQENICVENH